LKLVIRDRRREEGNKIDQIGRNRTRRVCEYWLEKWRKWIFFKNGGLATQKGVLAHLIDCEAIHVIRDHIINAIEHSLTRGVENGGLLGF